MFRKMFVLVFALPLTVSTLAAQWAQYPYYRVPGSTLPAFQISPYVGYMDFGRYLPGANGQDLLPNGPVYGGEVSLSLTRNVALYGELGYATSTQRVTPYGAASVFSGNTSAMWLYGGGLQLMAPFRAEDRHWLVPFVQVGAGGVDYRLYNYTNGNTTNDSRFAWNGGVGFDYHFTRQVGLRVMAKDYVVMFDLPRTVILPGVNPGGPSGGATQQVKVWDNNNNYAFTAGLNIGF